MEYESIILKDEITVRKIYTIHYFEYMKNFEFSGETHDFWELQCVDKGEIKVLDHILKAGQVIFHKPNEFHNLAATGVSAPNVVVVSFACTSPAMKFFRGPYSGSQRVRARPLRTDDLRGETLHRVTAG